MRKLLISPIFKKNYFSDISVKGRNSSSSKMESVVWECGWSTWHVGHMVPDVIKWKEEARWCHFLVLWNQKQMPFVRPSWQTSDGAKSHSVWRT